jgi:prepilin peptidase CpaA
MHAMVLVTSLGGLAALLVVAVWGDITRFTIPNWLNATIALLAPAYWYGAQFGVAEIGIQLALAAVVFLVFAGAFALGVMGGGDVKMLGALALWLRPDQILMMLVVMSLAGGLLTLALLVRHRLLHREGQPEIPYGVAISVAACLLFYEPIFNQFG